LQFYTFLGHFFVKNEFVVLKLENIFIFESFYF
jgi:hypothetical protein